MKHPLQTALLAATLVSAANAAGPFYTITTGAMEPTFLIGDHVLAPGGEPVSGLRRGDVIVFHYPIEPKVILIKRLVGLPGDHLRIKNGILVFNSKPMSEPYIKHSGGSSADAYYFSSFPAAMDGEHTLPPDIKQMLKHYIRAGELVVPPGSYFVLGDNRDDSFDSRSWGMVDGAQIIGVVHEIFASYDPQTKSPRAKRAHMPVPRGSLN